LATSWNPAANGIVYTLKLNGSMLYAGGAFTVIGGENRNRLAALDMSAQASAWNPDSNGTVYTLGLAGTTIYAGGAFSSMTGQPRANLAAIDATGQQLAWNPGSGGIVYALLPSGTSVYIGGDFTTVAGTKVSSLAAVGGVPVAPVMTTNALPVPQVGVPYSFGFLADGFPMPQFSVTLGTLPPGLTLDTTTGLLSGMPSQTGSYTFTITADNGVGSAVSQQFSLIVILPTKQVYLPLVQH
jgi:hypothetical protein